MSGQATRSMRTVLAACARSAPRLSFRKFLLVALAVLLAACGPETDVMLEALAATKPDAGVANVTGRIADAATGADLAGAVVTMAAAPVESRTGLVYPPPLTASSDAGGEFTLNRVAVSGGALLQVTLAGYVDAWVVVNTVGGFTTAVLVELVPVGASSSFDPALGGSTSIGTTAAATLAPGTSLVQPDGTPASGNVTLALTPLNMTQRLATTPGDFTTDVDGEILEGRGGVTVTATDSAGNAVDLATGQTATLRLPYSSRNTDAPPSTIELFRFDTASGNWIDAGVTATLFGTAPDLYYEAAVGQLGIWMAGAVLVPVAYVNGCVETEIGGSPVANVRVQAEGITYSGISAALTDGSGNFRIPVKPGSQLIVNGQLGNYLTNTVARTLTSSELNVTPCLTLAALSGAPRITVTWGEVPSDVDSHLFLPDGAHVYYSDKGALTAAPFAALDVDDVDGYGPEVITLRRLMVGSYFYGLRNFSQDFSPGMTDSPVLVELRRGLEVTRYAPGAGEDSSKDWWTAFRMDVDADCNVAVTALDLFDSGDDSGPALPVRPAPVAIQYCVPPP